MYRKNVSGQFVCFQGVDATTGGIKSGVTWTMRRCLDGTFAAGGGTVTEDGTTGWYKCALAQADTNGNDCSFNFTGTGAIPQTVNIVTTACDPTTATNFGITALPAVASGSAGAVLIDGTGTAAISNSGGKVLLQATQTGVTIPTVTTVTNQLTAAQIATGVWQDATAGDFTTASSIGKSLYTSGNAPGAASGIAIVGSNMGTVSSVTGAVGSVTAGVTVTTNNDKTGYSLTQAFPSNFSALAITAGGAITAGTVSDKTGYSTTDWTAGLTEAYRANGAAPTPAQALCEILAHLGESAIAGTTKTIKKLDHATTAETFTLDSATTPASITRAT